MLKSLGRFRYVTCLCPMWVTALHKTELHGQRYYESLNTSDTPSNSSYYVLLPLEYS